MEEYLDMMTRLPAEKQELKLLMAIAATTYFDEYFFVQNGTRFSTLQKLQLSLFLENLPVTDNVLAVVIERLHQL